LWALSAAASHAASVFSVDLCAELRLHVASKCGTTVQVEDAAAGHDSSTSGTNDSGSWCILIAQEALPRGLIRIPRSALAKPVCRFADATMHPAKFIDS
jgi:hypothetical protein